MYIAQVSGDGSGRQPPRLPDGTAPGICGFAGQRALEDTLPAESITVYSTCKLSHADSGMVTED